MSAKITTLFGHAVPPAPRHSVTVHMPKWENVEKYGADSRSVIASFHNAYPRMKPHRDIASLATAILGYLGLESSSCLLFSSFQSAEECIEYSVSPRRDNGFDKKPVPSDCIEIRAFKAKDQFFAVIFPIEYLPIVSGFWSTPGVGISSRFAEVNLAFLGQLVDLDLNANEQSQRSFGSSLHETLRERIVQYLQRAPLNTLSPPFLSADDVYFFPSGMATIYKPHSYLSSRYQGTTILFGMAFMNTITAFREFGASYKFFGLGTNEDLDALETFLQQEQDAHRKAQAIWAEFPANPLLVTPDLVRLRALADRYDTVLAIDDTIGSFANIDVIGMVDILVTSLTKSFNGYADIIAGSAILNPSSRHYSQLKALFDQKYIQELYIDDVVAIERNSRDYLLRTSKLNHNAKCIAEYLDLCAKDPESAVHSVHYPSINESGQYYEQFMRPKTPEFSAGYGCLLAVELEDIPTTVAFYDNLNVHNGPHLGAPFTLAFAYTMCAYAKELEWAAGYGLKPTQIRISAGLEDTDSLLEEFKIAVEAANSVKHKSKVIMS